MIKPPRPLAVAILAAGKGKRMKSELPKVLHPVGGKPMLLHVVELTRKLPADPIIAIIGHGQAAVRQALAGTPVKTVVQEEQLGTGHAVLQVEPLLKNFNGDLLVLSGDVPLLRLETLEDVLAAHYHRAAGATLLTAEVDDPTGYGRVLRRPDGTLDRIVEHRDCTPEQLAIREVNAGVYVFNTPTLFPALKTINNNNQQGEYYLPDALNYYIQNGIPVALQIVADPNEVAGVNTVEQLSEINRIFEQHYAQQDETNHTPADPDNPELGTVQI
jgi:UDP-N-acetylglucosamine diphosphorylase/glucosamine-1-phosphate N-acetyltransferase